MYSCLYNCTFLNNGRKLVVGPRVDDATASTGCKIFCWLWDFYLVIQIEFYYLYSLLMLKVVCKHWLIVSKDCIPKYSDHVIVQAMIQEWKHYRVTALFIPYIEHPWILNTCRDRTFCVLWKQFSLNRRKLKFEQNIIQFPLGVQYMEVSLLKNWYKAFVQKMLEGKL